MYSRVIIMEDMAYLKRDNSITEWSIILSVLQRDPSAYSTFELH